MTIKLALAFTLVSSLAHAGPETGTLPSIDFPTVTTTAKPGEWVLTVNKLQWERFEKAPDKEGVIFYSHEFVEAGPKASKFKGVGGDNVAPNSIIIPIPKGGKAKKGDILLTWWQSGSGMQRAIVVDAKDPKQPVVRYLDLDYDNPAKSRDKKTTIGQMDEQLKPDSFTAIGKPFDPGTTVACKDGKDHRIARVVHADGDKLLLTGWVGKLAARRKSDCTALPQTPKVKVKDKIMGEWVGVMKPATVTKIDPKIGRIWVKWDHIPGDKEAALAYGQVIAKL